MAYRNLVGVSHTELEAKTEAERIAAEETTARQAAEVAAQAAWAAPAAWAARGLRRRVGGALRPPRLHALPARHEHDELRVAAAPRRRAPGGRPAGGGGGGGRLARLWRERGGVAELAAGEVG